jgi:ribose transport system substrate-binding protein
VTQARAAIQALEGPFKSLTPSGPPFAALKYTQGKSAGIVAAMASDPGYQANQAAFEAAATVLGMHVSVCDGQNYSIAAETRCIQLFTNEHINVIVLSAVTPSEVAAPLAAAGKAGIQIISVNSTVEGAPLQPNVDAQVSFPYVESAKLMADGVIALSGGKGDVMVINSSDYVTSPPMKNEIEQTLSADCPQCKVTYPDVPIADWATQLTPLVQNAVHADPNLQYIVPLYDTEIPLINAGLKAANASSRVSVISMPGTVGLVPFIAQSNNPYAMAVGASEIQLGWAWADDAARLLAGQRDNAALKNAQIGIRVFDRSNISSINLKDPATWWGNFDIQNFYKQQWQIS